MRMEIERIIYKAKDGRTFYDPLECEEYEKTIGILEGSIGDFIVQLEKNTKREDYIFGMVKVMDGETGTAYTRATVCVDRLLEDWVNTSELSEEKRYAISTAGELTDTLKQLNKDLPCQYLILFSKDINFKNAGAMANYNKNAWRK